MSIFLSVCLQQVAPSGDDVCGGSEAVDLHLRQPGDRAALSEAAPRGPAPGVPAVSLPPG